MVKEIMKVYKRLKYSVFMLASIGIFSYCVAEFGFAITSIMTFLTFLIGLCLFKIESEKESDKQFYSSIQMRIRNARDSEFLEAKKFYGRNKATS